MKNSYSRMFMKLRLVETKPKARVTWVFPENAIMKDICEVVNTLDYRFDSLRILFMSLL